MPKTISLRGKIGVALLRMLGYHKRTAQTLAKYEALISQYPVKGTKLICNHGTWYGERDYIPVEFYGEGSLATYEGMTVRVPEKCDEYLTALYGDWRTPPPPEKRKGSHKNDACDTTKSYTEYFK
jgi:phosphorylcholine metabolism protein LicD